MADAALYRTINADRSVRHDVVPALADVCDAAIRIDLQGVDLRQYGVRIAYWGVTGGDAALAAKTGTAPHANILRDSARRLGHPVPP